MEHTPSVSMREQRTDEPTARQRAAAIEKANKMGPNDPIPAALCPATRDDKGPHPVSDVLAARQARQASPAPIGATPIVSAHDTRAALEAAAYRARKHASWLLNRTRSARNPRRTN